MARLNTTCKNYVEQSRLAVSFANCHLAKSGRQASLSLWRHHDDPRVYGRHVHCCISEFVKKEGLAESYRQSKLSEEAVNKLIASSLDDTKRSMDRHFDDVNEMVRKQKL